MKKAILLGAAGLLVTAVTASAQMKGYYIIRDTAAKKCMVMDEKPSTASTTLIDAGGSTVYKTRAEAEDALKVTAVCMEK